LLAPGLAEDDVRARLYTPPRYVERVARAPLPSPVPLRGAEPAPAKRAA
jgi:hypothetical protein